MKSVEELSKIAWCIAYFKPENEYLIWYTYNGLVDADRKFDDGAYVEFVNFCKALSKLGAYSCMDNCISLPKNFDATDEVQVNQFKEDVKRVYPESIYSKSLEEYCSNPNF